MITMIILLNGCVKKDQNLSKKFREYTATSDCKRIKYFYYNGFSIFKKGKRGKDNQVYY